MAGISGAADYGACSGAIFHHHLPAQPFGQSRRHQARSRVEIGTGRTGNDDA